MGACLGVLEGGKVHLIAALVDTLKTMGERVETAGRQAGRQASEGGREGLLRSRPD